MSLTLPTDAGEPMSAILVATPEVRRHSFASGTRQVSLRNTGTNTLWFSFDKKHWYDVACGTSWDDRVSVREVWYCTQVGKTQVAVIGLALVGA